MTQLVCNRDYLLAELSSCAEVHVYNSSITLYRTSRQYHPAYCSARQLLQLLKLCASEHTLCCSSVLAAAS
jgi:hypothetical protein